MSVDTSTKRFEKVEYTKYDNKVVVILDNDRPFASMQVEDKGLIPIIDTFVNNLNAYTPPETSDESS